MTERINLMTNRINLMTDRINLMTNRINLMTDRINLFGEAFFGRASHRVNAQASFQVRLRVVPKLTGFDY